MCVWINTYYTNCGHFLCSMIFFCPSGALGQTCQTLSQKAANGLPGLCAACVARNFFVANPRNQNPEYPWNPRPVGAKLACSEILTQETVPVEDLGVLGMGPEKVEGEGEEVEKAETTSHVWEAGRLARLPEMFFIAEQDEESLDRGA